MAKASQVHRGRQLLGRAEALFDGVARSLSSARSGLIITFFLCVCLLIGVVFPQMPEFARFGESQRDRWLEDQRGTFTVFTDYLDRAGFFEAFQSYWFQTGLIVLALSVSVYVVTRVPYLIRAGRASSSSSILRRAHFRLETAALDVKAAETVLRRRRYSVRMLHEEGETAVVGERFSWSRYGSLLTHASLLIFLLGGLVSWQAAYSQDLLIAEGGRIPVGGLTDRDQMLVEVVEFERLTDDEGRDLEYRTELIVYQGGEEVERGHSTVNSPLSYNGYRFHQIAYAEDGAALAVRDISGRMIYRETIHLGGRLPVPHVTLQDVHGATVYEGYSVPWFVRDDGLSVSHVRPAGEDSGFWLVSSIEEPEGLGRDDAPFRLSVVGTDDSAEVGPGETVDMGQYSVAFGSYTGSMSIFVDDLPGSSLALVQMVDLPDAPPELFLQLGESEPVSLEPGQRVRLGEHEYEFIGQRDFSGITVRRDPGTPLIWLGAFTLTVGLVMTFYLRHRRIVVKRHENGSVVAGIGGRGPDFRGEVESILDEIERRGERER